MFVPAHLFHAVGSVALAGSREILILRFVNYVPIDGVAQLLPEIIVRFQVHRGSETLSVHPGPRLKRFNQEFVEFVHRVNTLSL